MQSFLWCALWVVSGWSGAQEQGAGGSEKISEFGHYEGYSEPRFDSWVTTSLYVEMRDGVKLAVDVTRPAVDGEVSDEALPLVWTHSRYHRNPSALGGQRGGSSPSIRSMVDAMPALQRLVRHGYVVAAAGVRGSGASFGRFEGLFSAAETDDAAELIAWFAEQPWCDGNVGMYGGSYLGITQYMAASRHPPALKAIVPDVAAFDMYDLFYPGGIFREDMIAHWDQLTTQLDREWPAPVVDDDPDGVMRAQAIAQHADNWAVLENYSAAPYRDDVTEGLEWLEHGPSPLLDAINESDVAIYHLNGWFDVFALDATLWFANYEGPQRLTMGSWSHAGMADRALMAERGRIGAIEQHRWFDRWLKGIENGVDEEPRIQYALMLDPGDWEWRVADEWPPPGTDEVTLWFTAGPSGSIASAHDHGLEIDAPARAGRDDYEIDPSTTTGSTSRWDNAVAAAPVMRYDDLAENDAKSTTYTTAPLEEDLVVVGHPVVKLFVESSRGDVDLHVLLEEIDERGEVRYVSEGVLRASHRKLGEAPYDNLGLPWHRSAREDVEPLPAGQPAEVVLDLHPIANLFDAGHRLRVTVMGADADNTRPSPIELPATLSIHRGGEHASCLSLPVLPGG